MTVTADSVDAQSQMCRARVSGTSAETPSTPKPKVLRSPGTVAKNSRIPRGKAVNIDSESEVYRLRSPGTLAETPKTPREKSLRAPKTVAMNSRTPKEKGAKIDLESEVYRLRSPGTSAEIPKSAKEKALRSPGIVAKNTSTLREKAVKIDSKSEVYPPRSPGTSAESLTTPKEKALRFPVTVTKNSRTPKGEAIKIETKSDVYRLTSPGTSTETPTTPKVKALRSPVTVGKNSRIPKEKAIKIDSKPEFYRQRSLGTSAETSTTPAEKYLRSPGTSAETPTTKGKALRSPGTVTKNSSTPKEEVIDIDKKYAVYHLRSPATSAKTPTTPKEKALASPVPVVKNSRTPKEKALDKNSEVCRLRSVEIKPESPTRLEKKSLRSPGAVAKISKPLKEKAVSIDNKSEVYPLRSPGNLPVASGTPKVKASNNSSPIKRRDAAGVVLLKTDHRTKPLNNKEKCRSCDTISSMVSVNTLDDDQLEIELAVDKEYEKILLELDLLPEGLSPVKQNISHSVVSMEKSETTPNSNGLFHTIDGSRFSPIEEAELVLNTSNATAHASSANVIDKEAGAMNTSGHSDHLYSRPIIDTLQCHVKNEDEEREDVKTNSILPFELTPRQNKYRIAYQNPFQTPIWQKTTWEETETEIDFHYKCFNSSSEDSISSDSDLYSYSPPLLENDYMEKLYFLQQKYQDLDRISSSFSLATDLEEMELRKVNSNGASLHLSELVAPAEEFVDSDISLMDCKLSGHDFTLEKSLMKLDVIFKENEELEDNDNAQDPLYWPLNPNSYWQIEEYWDG